MTTAEKIKKQMDEIKSIIQEIVNKQLFDLIDEALNLSFHQGKSGIIKSGYLEESRGRLINYALAKYEEGVTDTLIELDEAEVLGALQELNKN